MRAQIPWKLRQAVLAANNGVCHYCSGEANEADHIVPLHKGGKDEAANLIAACKVCNQAKAAKLLPDDQMQTALAKATTLHDDVVRILTELGDNPPRKSSRVVRNPIPIANDMWAEVEEYQKREGAVTTADAVRRLIRAGLDAAAKKVKR